MAVGNFYMYSGNQICSSPFLPTSCPIYCLQSDMHNSQMYVLRGALTTTSTASYMQKSQLRKKKRSSHPCFFQQTWKTHSLWKKLELFNPTQTERATSLLSVVASQPTFPLCPMGTVSEQPLPFWKLISLLCFPTSLQPRSLTKFFSWLLRKDFNQRWHELLCQPM